MEFDFRVIVQKVKNHILADHFSWLTSGEEAKAIIDEAPKTALFIVNNVSSWGI